MELSIFIPGFGAPHIEDKIVILNRNLETISAFPWNVHVHICIYDPSPETVDLVQYTLEKYEPKVKSTVHVEKGIVAQFIVRHGHPSVLKSRYVMILLDDVLLSNWSWSKLLFDYHEHNIDIMSPSMTLDSKYVFQYMLHKPEDNVCDILRITSACELFCYFMRHEVYEAYYQELSEDHPWLWGIDLVLTKHLGLRVAIMNYMQMKHFFQNTNTFCENDIIAFEKMNHYLSKFGESQESLANQPACLESRLIFHRIRRIGYKTNDL